MNSRLVSRTDLKAVSFEDVSQYILENKVKWVTISGGEPTMSRNLPILIKRIKKLGSKVNLCTNGLNPEAIEQVLDDLSYVTLDIKTNNHEIYEKWTNELSIKEKALTNVIFTKCKLITSKMKRDDFDYEIRTTIVPKFVNEQTISEISGIIAKGEKWVLQKFRRTPDVSDEAGEEDVSDENILKIADVVRKNGKEVEVRYI